MEHPSNLKIPCLDHQSRWSAIFRLFLAVPAMMVFLILVLIIPLSYVLACLSIMFFDQYPRWLFAFNLSISRFKFRLFAYLLLLTNEYPSFSEMGGVQIEVNYPDKNTKLSRLLPLVKWLLIFPHFFTLLLFSFILVWLITPVAWGFIVFRERYPQTLFNFPFGVLRWILRVYTYSLMLTTDQYPSFSWES